MRRHFGLRDAIVVDIDRIPRPAATPRSNRDEWNNYDDKIHQYLGYWAGRALVTLIRNGDIVGTGGGRGPHYTADKCIVPETTICYPKRIVSLTGAMSTRVWGRHEHVARELDADNVAISLKGGLKGAPSCGIIELPHYRHLPFAQKQRSTDRIDGRWGLSGWPSS